MVEDLSWLDAGPAGAIPEEDPTAGDYGTILKAGTQEIAGGAAAGLRYLAEGHDDPDGFIQATQATAQYLQKLMGSYAEDNIESISPEARKRLEYEITSAEFWEHPLSGIGLKLTRMSPSVIAAVVPAMAVSGAVMATMVAGGVAGGLSAGTTIDEIFNLTDKMDDNLLRAEVPYYDGLRADGISETQAREMHNEKLLGIKPHLLFLLGAATGAAGPAGQLVRAAKGGQGALMSNVERGLAKRVGQSFTEAGTAEAVQTGAEDLSVQTSAIELGTQEEIDYGRLINATIEGGVLGGIMGGAAGIPSGRKSSSRSEPEKTGRTQTLPKTPEDPDAGNPQSAPTRSDTKYPKTEPKPSRGKKKTRDDYIIGGTPGDYIIPPGGELAGLNPEVAAAMAPPQNVQAAATRSASDYITPRVTPEVTPPPARPQVTPKVQAAQQVQAELQRGENEQRAQQEAAEGKRIQEEEVARAQVQEIAPAPVPVTPEPPAKPKVMKVGGEEVRVLKDESATAQKYRKTAKAKAEQNQTQVLVEEAAKKAAKKKAEDGSKARKESKAIQQKAIDDAVTSKVLMEKYPPTDAENDYASPDGEKSEASNAAILKRAHAMVDEAKELGVKIYASLQKKTDAKGVKRDKDPATILLTQATTLIKKTQNKKGATEEDYFAFVASEFELRTGEVIGTLQDRKDAAAAAGATGVRANEKAAAKEKARADAKTIDERQAESLSEAEQARLETIGEDRGASVKAQQIEDTKAPGFGEGAANKGTTRQPTAAERAKYETPVAPKVTPEVTPKVAKVIAKAAKPKPKTKKTKKAIEAKVKILKVQKKAKDKAVPKSKAVEKAQQKDKAALEELIVEAELEQAAIARTEAGHGEVVAPPKKVGKRGSKTNPITRESAGLPPLEKSKSGKGRSVMSPELAAQYAPDSSTKRSMGLPVAPHPQTMTAAFKKWFKNSKVVDEQGNPLVVYHGTNKSFTIFKGWTDRGGLWSDRLTSYGSYFTPDPGYAGNYGRGGDFIPTTTTRLDTGEQISENVDHRIYPVYLSMQNPKIIGDPPDMMRRGGRISIKDAMETSMLTKADLQALIEQGYDGIMNWKAKEFIAFGQTQIKSATGNTGTFSSRSGDIRATEGFKPLSEEDAAWYSQEGQLGRQALRTENINAPHTKGVILSVKARNIISADDLTTLAGFHDVAHKLLPFFQRRMMEVAGDIEVKFVTDEGMDYFFREDPNIVETGKTRGGYNLNTNEIVVANSLLGRRTEDGRKKRRELTHVVLHEIAHAATMAGLRADGEIYNNVIGIMNEAAEHMAQYPNLYERVKYAFSDVEEFVAEAMSRPELQAALARIPVSSELAARLQLGKSRTHSMWDAFVAQVRVFLKLPPGTHTMLDATMRVVEQSVSTTKELEGTALGAGARAKAARAAERVSATVASTIQNDLDPSPEVDADIKQGGTPKMLWLYMFDRMASMAGRYFSNDVIMQIHKTLERIRTMTHKIEREAEPIINRLFNAENKYKSVMVRHPITGEQVSQWDLFTDNVHDETAANVDASRPIDDQKHLGKKRLDKVYAKAQWAKLNKVWKALPEELKAVRQESMDFFTAQQNEASLDLVKNILGTIGIKDTALAERIHTGETIEGDTEQFDPGFLSHMLKAKMLSKISGPYFPLMRRGDFVVNSRMKFKLPDSSKQLDENVFEFEHLDNVKKYLAEVDLPPTVRSKWVDKNTGSEYFAVPDGDPVKVLKEDSDAVQRWEVTVENQFTEFVETEADAGNLRAELENRKEKDHYEIRSAPRKFQPDKINTDLLGNNMNTFVSMLKKQKNYKDLPNALQRTMVQALNEVAVRTSSSTRVQSRRLPRRNVAGYSTDLTRNTVDYSQSMAGYLARLRLLPTLDKHVADMNEQADTDYSKETSMGRGAIRNEVMYRLNKQNGFAGGGKWSPAIQRLLVVSFISKLASPMYSVINATQPAMMTFPVLASRHGAAKTVAMMARVYSDIGAMQTIKSGAKATGRHAMKPGALPTSFLEDVRKRLTDPDEIEATYVMEEWGTLESDAGLELDRTIKATKGMGGKADKAIAYLEGMARQMPRAVETVNRTVSALSAYRLERAKGADHETALDYAHEITNSTQLLYSNTNAPPVFNHPLGKMTFQFKKFGLGMYHLIGQQIGKAYHNASPGDRAEGLKALGTMVAMHVAVAGAMGLPTEPFKALLMGANFMGFTDKSWADVDQWMREVTAEVAGKELGEVLNRGLPRLLGVDVSSRIGLENLLLFGEPRSSDQQDVKAYMLDMVGGAPGSLILDIQGGSNALMDGDLLKAAEKLIPIKIAADSVKAYRRATEGKKSKSGRQTMEPYSLVEAGIRAFGATPARDAENREHMSHFYDKKGEVDEVRRGFMYEWIDATPRERGKLWGRIEVWNRGMPRDARLTRSGLMRYKANRGKEEGGMRVGKRERHIKTKIDTIYNQ